MIASLIITIIGVSRVVESLPPWDTVTDLVISHAPALQFSRDEQFFPSTVDWYVARVTRANGYMNPNTALQHGDDTIPMFAGQNPNSNTLSAYAIVEEIDSTTFDAVYWVLFPYTKGRHFDDGIYYNQMGVWGYVTIRFVRSRRYAIHLAVDGYAYVQECRWDSSGGIDCPIEGPMTLIQGTHPKVFVGINSHGMYASAGGHCEIDQCSNYCATTCEELTGDGGPIFQLWNGKLKIYDKTHSMPDWYNWDERWGPAAMDCRWWRDDTHAMFYHLCKLSDGDRGPKTKYREEPDIY